MTSATKQDLIARIAARKISPQQIQNMHPEALTELLETMGLIAENIATKSDVASTVPPIESMLTYRVYARVRSVIDQLGARRGSYEATYQDSLEGRRNARAKSASQVEMAAVRHHHA